MEIIQNFLPDNKDKLNIDIDDLLDNKIGYGHWQRVAALFLMIPSAIGGLIVLNTVFTATPYTTDCLPLCR